jgi:hypothetical protein
MNKQLLLKKHLLMDNNHITKAWMPQFVSTWKVEQIRNPNFAERRELIIAINAPNQQA